MSELMNYRKAGTKAGKYTSNGFLAKTPAPVRKVTRRTFKSTVKNIVAWTLILGAIIFIVVAVMSII